MARYPVAYPCLCPIDVESRTFDFWPGTSATSPSDVSQANANARCASNELTTPASHVQCAPDIQYLSLSTSESSPNPSEGPRTAGPTRTFCDLRLSQFDIEKWTDVRIDTELAAGALSFYLETDHPILGLFDADLFLHDLVSGEHNFCSPMLVNSVLAWSCVSTRRRPHDTAAPSRVIPSGVLTEHVSKHTAQRKRLLPRTRPPSLRKGRDDGRGKNIATRSHGLHPPIC